MRTHMTSPAFPATASRLMRQILFGLVGILGILAALFLQTSCSSWGSGKRTANIAPSNLAYSSSTAAYTTGMDITPNHPSSQGGAVQSYVVAPPLPLGLSLDASTGVISGRPTAITAEAPYVVTAINAAGSTTASLLLKVNPPAPVITTQPASQDISSGLTVTFSVVASGTGTLTYQWQKDEVAIPGEVNATYTTPPVSHPATFKVVVKDAYGGQAESDEATLGVLPGTLVEVLPLSVGRYDHAVVLLQDKRTLIVGGRSSAGPLATLEIYDPAGKSFTTVPATLNQARVSPTATLFADGTVLILGGWNSAGYVASAEIFNPSGNTLTPVGSMSHPRALHTATLLADGTVLIVGGTDGNPVGEIEYFDPTNSSFRSAGILNTARIFPSTCHLQDGTVLVAGGWDGTASLDSAELYTPSPSHGDDSMVVLPNRLIHRRYLHTATVLANGTVLLSGGIGPTGTLATAELFTPTNGIFTATGSLKAARQIHAAILLADGTVLVSGGWNGSGVVASFERYDPGTGQFAGVSGPAQGFHSQTATLQDDGNVLIAGGYNGAPLAGSALWKK